MPFLDSSPRRLSALFVLALVLGLGCSEEHANAAPTDPAMEAIDEFILASPVDRSNRDWKGRLKKPPRVPFAPDKTYLRKLVTSEGIDFVSSKEDESEVSNYESTTATSPKNSSKSSPT